MKRLLLLAFLCACGAKPAPTCPVGPKFATEADFQAATKAVCDCTTDTCREKAVADLDELVMTMKDVRTFQGYKCDMGEKALDELRILETDACGCTDDTCAAGVSKDVDRWSKKYLDTKGTAEQADQAGDIMQRLADCLAKFSPPPDKPAP
jgi:hypothetical protein